MSTASKSESRSAEPAVPAVPSESKLLEVVSALAVLTADATLTEEELLPRAAELIRGLVAVDDWLPDALAVSHPVHYQQHLLYGDPLDRFSLVSFVWGPGQKTPIHNHTVWGVLGVLRGAEYGQRYVIDAAGAHPSGAAQRMEAGDVDIVSPTVGDVHEVRNAFDDRVSISIHLYGGNIGRIRRSVFDAASGVAKPFVSGYSNTLTPNLWAQPAP